MLDDEPCSTAEKFPIDFYTNQRSKNYIEKLFKKYYNAPDFVDEFLINIETAIKNDKIEYIETEKKTEYVNDEKPQIDQLIDRILVESQKKGHEDIKKMIISDENYNLLVAKLNDFTRLSTETEHGKEQDGNSGCCIARRDVEISRQYMRISKIYNKKTHTREITPQVSPTPYSLLPFLPDFLLQKYMYFPEEFQNVICSVWTLGTYVHQIFDKYPYLFINAPKASGKTKLTKLITFCSYNGYISSNQSISSIYYMIDAMHSTMGIDEAEKLSNKEKSNELNNILLAGFEKGLPVFRVPKQKDGTHGLQKFEVYSPKIITNITGVSNDALESRMIPIRLIKTKSEKANLIPKASDKIFLYAKMQCLVWAYENWEKVYDEYNTKRDEEKGFVGRNYDLFKPLLSICKIAFPDRYDNFLEQCKKMNKEIITDLSENTHEVMLLKTVRKMYDETVSPISKDGWVYVSDILAEYRNMHYPTAFEYKDSWFYKKLDNGRKLLGFKKRKVAGKTQYCFPKKDFDEKHSIYVLPDTEVENEKNEKKDDEPLVDFQDIKDDGKKELKK